MYQNNAIEKKHPHSTPQPTYQPTHSLKPYPWGLDVRATVEITQ
jgi:hypothetical protein